MSTRRSPNRRGANRPRPSNRSQNALVTLLGAFLRSRRLAPARWAGGAALALLFAVGLSFMGQASSHQVASAAPVHRAWVGRASAPELPAVIHFFDQQRNTAYTVWLRDTADRKVGSFVFTLRDHTQLRGYAPITQAADNTFIQSSTQPVPTVTTSAAVNCTGRAAADSGEQSVNIAIQARIDPSGLVAYAQVAYAGCSTKQGGEGVMASGCTSTTCTDVLAQVGPAVQQYGSSIVAASADRGQAAWNKVYAQISQTTRGQYTPEQFAAQLNQQIDSVGRITAVSPITGPPVIQYDTAGQAFFAVKQQITYRNKSSATTRDITSYFLMEDGQWVFWFSA